MSKILRDCAARPPPRPTPASILEATPSCCAGCRKQRLPPEDVESAIFTSSPDLHGVPARAARLLG